MLKKAPILVLDNHFWRNAAKKLSFLPCTAYLQPDISFPVAGYLVEAGAD